MLSLAPADMPGTTGTPGKRAWIASLTSFISSGRSGEASLATDAAVERGHLHLGIAATSASLSPAHRATEVPGKMRQLMLAVARWGSALVAWPALAIVATQVVPVWPT
jgi:hypothetical protein